MEVRINLHVFSYYEFVSPTYRVWIDESLYTEREFPKDIDIYNSYVNENIILELDPGEHTITLEKVRPKGSSFVWVEKAIINSEKSFKELWFEESFEPKQIIKFNV